MAEFVIHPDVYRTNDKANLLSLLEVSGFANFNGCVRFLEPFRKHVDDGGEVIAYLGGKSSQRLSSKVS